MNIRDGVRATAFGLTAILTTALVACGGGDSSPQGPATLALSGSVHGGQQPVSGAHVTAYVAGNGGSLANGVALACVSTNASGAFSFVASGGITCGGSLPTSFTCPSTNCPSAASFIYLVASGGNPGLTVGTNNTALTLMAALGPFNALSGQVNITELTTVGAVYPLAQMMGVASGPALASRLSHAALITAKSPHLDNAFTRANSLVKVTTSSPGTALPVSSTCTGAGGTGADPINCGAEEKLNTLANALAACVNTTGPSSTACMTLFCVATPGATFSGGTCSPPGGGAIPTDTLQSALSIALNAGVVPTAGIFSLPAATPPFAPGLNGAPNDWALALNVTGGGLSQPAALAIDSGDNVWVGNPGNNSVTELSNTGAAISPASGFTAGGNLNQPGPIAVDANGNVWVANVKNNSLAKLNSSGGLLATPFTGGGLNQATGIAIDSSGNIWLADSGGTTGGVSEFSNSGAPLSPATTGYTVGGLNKPDAIAIDGGGAIWVANNGASSVTELSNSGTAISTTGFTGGGLNEPDGIAIDASGNVWVANFTNAVSELNHSGTPVSATGFTVGGLNGPVGTAIDGGGNVWLANLNGSITELNGSGAALSPGTGFIGGGLGLFSDGIAIDASGNVWVTNPANASVTELVGAAVPKKTPVIGPPQSP